MKKSIIFLLLVIGFTIFPRLTRAEANYQNFQEINLAEGKMLERYTDKEYQDYYKKVDKRKFWGWRVHYVHRNIETSYISETVFSYYNNGTSTIKYDYSLKESNVAKLSVSGTGSISYSLNGTKNAFKHGLDAALKLESSYSKTVTMEAKKDLSIDVEPNTVANLKIVGEGKLTNGVAAKYIFWIRTNRGGFEYFIITTQYPRLEVLPL